MILADWIALGVVVAFALIGLIVGFGNVLKFFTSGIFGVIISLVVCYFLYGIVLNWDFVKDLMTALLNAVESADNWFCDFLVKIRIDIVAVCVAMFIVVQIVRIIIVSIIKNIVEINNPVVKVINKLFGMVLAVAILAMLGLIAFQVIAWIGGNTSARFADAIADSKFRLDYIFLHNPLNQIASFKV